MPVRLVLDTAPLSDIIPSHCENDKLVFLHMTHSSRNLLLSVKWTVLPKNSKHTQMTLDHGWLKINSSSTTTKQLFSLLSPLPSSLLTFLSQIRLLLALTIFLSLILLGILDLFQRVKTFHEETYNKTTKLLILSWNGSVPFADLSLKINPNFRYFIFLSQIDLLQLSP